MHIIVGGILEKEGKILMVQEKKKFCYGKWNIPAGHLDPNETIIEGAIREIREETGCEVKATGVAIVANKVMPDDVLVEIIFSTKLVNEDIRINPDEILDVKWIDKEDILNNMDEELRDITFIKKPIMNIIDGKVASLDVIGTI